MPLPNERKSYTYADYLTWPEEERWELIDGVPYQHASPSWQHQAVLMELSRQLANYFLNKTCQVFTAPFDLRLPETDETDENVKNVFQPDILVICKKDGLKGAGYHGAPSLIVEITSPSTSKRDKVLKFNKYEQAGVAEYWIVEPEAKFVSVFTLQENKRYGRPENYTEMDQIKDRLFDGLQIDLNPVFAGI